jgi:hypothetical protein
MTEDDDLPQTFREVGIFLRSINRNISELKEEVDGIKRSVSKLAGLIFTAIIGPLIVAIIVAYILKNNNI